MAVKIKCFIISAIAALLLILLSASISAQCAEDWQCSSWENCLNEKTSRNCYDANDCGTSISKPAETASCKDIIPYCYDKILNQDESDVDCGGKICAKCGLKKACFVNEDCNEGYCINSICALESAIPAPAPGFPWIYLIEAIAAILIILAAIVLGKKVKKRKIIIYSDKKRGEKEKTSEKQMIQRTKQSRIKSFAENLSAYFRASRPVPKTVIREEKKDLLNKPSYKNQRPAKRWMLENIKEVYEND